MPLSISKFRENFRSEPAPTNRFEVYFSGGPEWTGKVATKNPGNLQFRLDTAELPPRSLATVPDKIYGPLRNMPYTSTYVDTTMSFICTSDGMKEKRFFDSWQNYINDTTTYDIQYWKNFTCEIKLLVYSNMNTLMYACKFHEAYPMIVSGIQLGQANDEFARISVTFSFFKWTTSDLDDDRNSSDFESEAFGP